MTELEFQRARRPAQKEQRRRELLASAIELLDGGLDAVTLSAIARTAGVAKSNVYRYFESREEILLELLLDDLVDMVTATEKALAPLAGTSDINAVARVVTRVLADRPRLCSLVSVVANVLEHNLSTDVLRDFKEQVLEVSIRIGNALHAAVPGLAPERAPALIRYLNGLIAGLWPMAHPPAALEVVLDDPHYAPLCCRFEDDFAGALAALLRGESAR